jgi:hypothetical protein
MKSQKTIITFMIILLSITLILLISTFEQSGPYIFYTFSWLSCAMIFPAFIAISRGKKL